VPGAAVPTSRLSVAPPPVVTDAGLKDAVAPLGAPETDRLIVSALPLSCAVNTLLDPLVPCTTLRLLGLAEIVKSGNAVTVSVTVVEWIAAPSVPVTVSV
jgi:hypothetical protein